MLSKEKFASLFTVPLRVAKGNKFMEINALLDLGSNVTILSNSVVKKLGLEDTADAKEITWGLGGINTHGVHEGFFLPRVDIQSLGGDILEAFNVRSMDRITDMRANDWSSISNHLHEPIMKPVNEGKIDLLIGTDNMEFLLFSDHRFYKNFTAIKTILGWTVSKRNLRISDPGFVFPSPRAGLPAPISSTDCNFVLDVDLEEHDEQEMRACLASLAKAEAEAALEEEEATCLHGGGSTMAQMKREEVDVLKSIHESIERYWKVDEFPDNGVTVEEEYCISKLRDSYHEKDGKAYVDPLWKPGQPEEGLNTYGYAVCRLESVLKKLNEKEFECIDKIFQAYVDSGIVEEVEVQRPYQDDGLYWAHFPVHQPKSETTPVRPVMDGAAKCIKGKSINEYCYLSGPNLINDLTKVLTRFRKYDVAFCGDISKMFLKIQVPEEFRRYNRFVWVDKDDRKKKRIFQFTGHLFGNNGSPTCSIYATQRNADKFEKEHPKAVETIKKSTIVDDHIDSAPTVEEAVKIINGLVEIHDNIGLKIAKFASNSIEVGERLPPGTTKSDSMLMYDKYVKETELAPGTESKMPQVRTLGQYWNMVEDCLTYSDYEVDANAVWSKVACLSQHHRIFDPLQLASPILLEPKLFLQSLWSRQADWKDPLTEEEITRWKTWLEELPGLKKLRFPRVLMPGLPEDVKSKQLHVFCDASKEAYAAVAYVRVEYKDNRPVHTAIVQAKSRVNPIKLKRTIPKLELMSIELGCRLAKHCMDPLEIGIDDVHISSDSKTALQWLRLDARTLQVLCHNYCVKIQDFIPVERVKWVAGTDNPADLPTRPKTVPQLLERFSLWLKGPVYLANDQKDWPELPALDKSPDVLMEMKKEFKLFAPANSFFTRPRDREEKREVDVDKAFDSKSYRSLAHMKRVFSYVMRFVNAARSKTGGGRYKKDVVSGKEMDSVERRLVYLHQRRYFKEEIDMLEKNTLSSTHVLRRLGAFMSDGDFPLLRLSGRLSESSHLKESVRYPILLHSASDFATKLIQDRHVNVLKHAGGVKCLVCELHRSYWLIGAFPKIRKVLRECVECSRAFPKPRMQQMAPLPEERVPSDLGSCPPVFNSVAVDVAGPWRTSQGRAKARVKRWLLVFRCTVTGAICLDMLWDMSEDGFLRALQRFCNRFQTPQVIICDQGTNFVGGKNTLEDLRKAAGLRSIEFRFAPADAPHFSGLVERFVQSAKQALRVILKDATVNDEELYTAFSSAERILNDRPVGLLYEKGDLNDGECLTPSHFMLRGRIGEDLLPKSFSGNKKRFAYINGLANQFWSRLCKELSIKLRARNKWLHQRGELDVGDVVVVLDDEGHRVQSRYPIGLITGVSLGPDGLARRFDVRMANGNVLERACNKLYLLHRSGKSDETDTEEIYRPRRNPDRSDVSDGSRRSRVHHVYLL